MSSGEAGASPNPDPGPPPPNGDPGPPLRPPANPPKGNEHRLAMLSVGATLIVAIVGAITTLVVALLGASNDRQKSADDFRRTQQQTAYVEFINATIEATKTFDKWWSDIGYRGKDNKLQLDAISALGVFDEKLQIIKLVGSDDTVGRALDVVDKVGKAYKLLADEVDNIADGKPLIADADNAYAKLSSEIIQQEDRFVESARRDLQAFVN